jgi:hypothetical protein
MAKYKNREVSVMRIIPNMVGDQVLIEHRELLGQSEIVPKSAVVLTKDEKAAWDKEQDRMTEDERRAHRDNDFRVEGETDTTPVPLPMARDVAIQRQAEDNLVRAEQQAKDNAEWQKNHPQAPAGAKAQLDAIKVVPYRDEAQKPAKK